VATAIVPENVDPNDPAELQRLVERAQKGDEKTLPALREVLKRPHVVESLGNLATISTQVLINKFTGKDIAVREGLLRKMDGMRDELGGPTPSAIERLLIDRIVICWLHLHHLEYLFSAKESMSLTLATYYQKSIDRAQKRYMAAIRTLVLVRRLALPALQLNIAQKQQVNNA
jgi:hypothetical protein